MRDDVFVTGLVTQEWSRYGKKRLYVKASDGSPVGWVDLLSGQRVVECADQASQFHEAVDQYHADHPVTVSSAGTVEQVGTISADEPTVLKLAIAEVAPPDNPVAEDVERRVASDADMTDWVDLSLNLPGQAARAQALAEFAAQKEQGKTRAFLQHLFDMKTDERAWRVGADGEESIGSRLEQLRKHGWHVLHAVPVGDRGSDIDHVVIGPGGVFTLNTKNHPGRSVWVGRYAVKVDGHSQPYLRNSRFEAQRAAKLLTAAVGEPVEVTPVLVFLTGTIIPKVTVKQPPDDVRVLDRMDIPSAFKRARAVLTPAQVETVYEQARRSATWGAGSALLQARPGS